MPGTIAQWFKSRFTEPAAWFAITVIGTWGVSAVWGVSLLPLLGWLGIAASVGEWFTILRWRVRPHRRDSVQVKQWPDRWKLLLLALIAIVTLALDFWIDRSLDAGISDYALTVFGISTLITLGYAWWRPIELTPTGLILGTSSVDWRDVENVSSSKSGQHVDVRLRFRQAHHLYGTRLSLRVPGARLQELMSLIPPEVSVANPADDALIRKSSEAN